MAIPVKLDFCPRDGGCTSRTVWKDPDTGELYTMRTKTRTGREDVVDTSFVPHICTNKIVGPPTVLYLSKWENSRTGFVRFVGPRRMIRSALIPPTDKKANRAKEWVFKTLFTIPDAQWVETELPEEFKHVPFYKKER